jgi:signal transducing adaptor molecule
MVGQQPQPNETQQPQYPARDPTPRIPSNSKPAPIQTSSPPPAQCGMQQTGHRPQSTYSNPQELATTSPTVHGTPSAYSASVYSQEDSYSATVPPNQQIPLQQQYSAYVPPTQAHHPPYEPPAPPNQQSTSIQQPQQKYNAYVPPQQPTYEPPMPPAGSPVQMNAGYPIIKPHDARNTLPSQGQYKPYQRPESAGGHTGGGSSTSPGGPADFYRQSTAY